MDTNTPHPIELFFSSAHPMSEYVDADFTGSAGGTVKLTLEASDHFVRDGETGEVHTGFLTVVLDSIMGGAVMGVLEKLQPIATVGLSVHHLRRPRAGEAICGEAQCTSTYNDLAYVTGEILSADSGELLAMASGTFMIGTRATPIGDKAKQSRAKESLI